MRGFITSGFTSFELQVGPIGLVVMGIIATHCMGILVDTSHRLCEK